MLDMQEPEAEHPAGEPSADEAAPAEVEGFIAPTLGGPVPMPLPNIVSPRDPATGLPTGKRRYKPFPFRMSYDQ